MENNCSLTHEHRKVTFETPQISRLTLGKPPFPTRKLSFPAALHANLLGIASNGKLDDKQEQYNAKRRFSNVSDAVSRKLSTTIGWRIPAVPPKDVIAQGRVLCGQYIRNRLKRSGIFNKKMGLYRLRSMVGTTSGIVVREVFPGLIGAGIELERMHPKLYTNVARHTSLTPGGIIVSDEAAAGLLVAIGHQLFKSDISWGKVISIFAIAGGLAVDCVTQGHSEYINALMDGMEEILRVDLGTWIASNGGWPALTHLCRTEDDEVTLIEYVTLVIIVLLLILIFYFIFRLLVRLGIF
ncbi:PREDICTED: bcl-2-related ovarian killer protein homolog A-like [Nicrophorus vespilloides]|uniref:Bcl-2-related ovarian killer protein homolog A-like n=1 Tax=Nicrophorus vespilloides TaxID=110193 RepID=A0ABM1M525_NICVS|nr:PREDICTED: bcl-2-related ovarian killer protein homolog A-like [Nicrophorus vespilloides]